MYHLPVSLYIHTYIRYLYYVRPATYRATLRYYYFYYFLTFGKEKKRWRKQTKTPPQALVFMGVSFPKIRWQTILFLFLNNSTGCDPPFTTGHRTALSTLNGVFFFFFLKSRVRMYCTSTLLDKINNPLIFFCVFYYYYYYYIEIFWCMYSSVMYLTYVCS